ncbi:MAG: type II secretion system F family protein [Capsulimonadaceae bacterium]|nr:type II secretion system F family protein [Capsulimonadaceae bacterium]
MIYTYEAKNTSGQTVTGSLEAESERVAATRVREMGYYPMRFAPAQGTIRKIPINADVTTAKPSDLLMTPRRPAGDWFLRSFVYPVFTGVSLKDLSVWYHQMAAMLNAGVPLQRTLETLEEQSPPGIIRSACRAMKNDVLAGCTLSEGMSRYPHIFTELQIEFVRSSEHTGGLAEMMNRLAEYLEKDFALRQMVKKETFYPKLTFVLSFLLPNLVVMVMQGAQAYIETAVRPLIELAVVGGAFYVAFRYAMQSRTFAFTVDAIKSYIPYFGRTVRILAIAKFSRALASLYSAGILLPAGMTIAARVSGNNYLAALIGKAVASVNEGVPLAEAFRKTQIFPPMFLSMVHTGEETGQVDEMLNKVADVYDEEGQLRLHQSVQVLTNLMFLVVAAIVGIIVIRFYSGMASQVLNM